MLKGKLIAVGNYGPTVHQTRALVFFSCFFDGLLAIRHFMLEFWKMGSETVIVHYTQFTHFRSRDAFRDPTDVW